MSALPETWLVHLIRMAEEDPDMLQSGRRSMPSIENFPDNERASNLEALSACGSQRRRSESNRRMEVLQTSALPLGYGAGDS